MTGRSFILWRAAAFVALLSPCGALAAPVPAAINASGRATVLKSLTVLKQADLDFGKLVAAGAGTAVINPVSGAVTTTGAVMPMGTSAHRALFTATGSRNSVVLIKLPKNPVTLTRVGGTETMTLDSWTLSGAANRNVIAKEPFTFAVGGTLHINANQAEGTYTGMFTVDVQYN
jgi:hypothetical protein